MNATLGGGIDFLEKTDQYKIKPTTCYSGATDRGTGLQETADGTTTSRLTFTCFAQPLCPTKNECNVSGLFIGASLNCIGRTEC